MAEFTFQNCLKAYSHKELSRLGEVGPFRQLVEQYGAYWYENAREDELNKAFGRSVMHEIEEALGIEREIDDMVPLARR